jgi:phosphoenolpyruvate---glycerone phosphotransferase subunit DhaL
VAEQPGARLLDAETARAWMLALAAAVDGARDRLTELDSAIGDGDHGANLQRGFRAVVAALDDSAPATPGAVLLKTGTTLISSVGGASGPLYGSAFRAMGKALDVPAADAGQLAAAFAALETEAAGGDGLGAAVSAAADAAEEAALATVPLQARKGRASYLGPRSVGHQDPGATSTALLFRVLADVLG